MNSAKYIRTALKTVICALCVFTTFASFSQSIKRVLKKASLRAVQQKAGFDPEKSFIDRVDNTPDDVLKMFREEGMSPTKHQLTKQELEIVASAFKVLPPLHQRVLKQHLKSFSFLDNMPNTALTSPVVVKRGINLYHITFRAGILHQNITEWINEKERTCFEGGDSTIKVSIEAGLLSAFIYILLHEGTHVVDGSLQLNLVDSVGGKPKPNKFIASFSKGIWKNYNTLSWPVTDSIALQSRFRLNGRRYKVDEAVAVYQSLSKTPFVSLYSTASWHEDLAELLTVYHLTNYLKQPFRVVVSKNGKEMFNYEPMKSATVQQRLALLNYFYSQS